jgi:hypothetical protein
VVSSDLFNALELEVLLDAAEGLLLMPSVRPAEIRELQSRIDMALSGLVAVRRLEPALAGELRERIGDCGPPLGDFAAVA